MYQPFSAFASFFFFKMSPSQRILKRAIGDSVLLAFVAPFFIAPSPGKDKVSQWTGRYFWKDPRTTDSRSLRVLHLPSEGVNWGGELGG